MNIEPVKTPYTSESHVVIKRNVGGHVVRISSPHAEGGLHIVAEVEARSPLHAIATADFIASACNAHVELAATLSKIRPWLDCAQAEPNYSDCQSSIEKHCMQIEIDELRAAITKAIGVAA